MMWAAGVVLCLVTIVLAWTTARQRPEHRPIAALLMLGLGADVARQVLATAFLRPAHIAAGDGAFTGWARVVGHVDEALFLAYPAGLAALALWVLLKRRPWPVLAVYGATLAALVLGYPTVRGPLLGRVYSAVELAAVAVWLGGVVTWVRRRDVPTLASGVTLLLGAVEIVTLLPFKKGPFAYWPIAQASYMTLYVVLIVLYGGALWGRGSSSASNSRSA